MAQRDVNFSDLAVCAVRYALGRETYVSYSVPKTILNNIDLMRTNSLKVIVQDITAWKEHYGKIGMECDENSWLKFKAELEQELERRRSNGSREALRNQN